MVMICTKNDRSGHGAPKRGKCTDLAVLHDVQLPQPCLVKRIARRVNDMAEPVLLREH